MGKYRKEWDAIEKSDSPSKDQSLDALRKRAKPEINELIIAEIDLYRSSRRAGAGCDLHQRIEQLEEEIAGLRAAVEEAQAMADEALALAEEAVSCDE